MERAEKNRSTLKRSDKCSVAFRGHLPFINAMPSKIKKK